MRAALLAILALAAGVNGTALAASGPEGWAGTWDFTLVSPDAATTSRVELHLDHGKLVGAAQALDENGFFAPLEVTAEVRGDQADLGFTSRKQPVASLRLRLAKQQLVGSGAAYGVPVTVTAARPQAVGTSPTVHDFKPSTFHTQFSGRIPPVLRIKPGDTVRTTTLDNEGQDAALAWRGMPGNTLTGPFFIEGARPGDTLVVHLDRVALNRDSAKMYSRTLNSRAQPEPQTPAPAWGRTWVLDRAKGVARLEQPGDRLAGLELPVAPMVGSIGVAPPLNQSVFAGDLGPHGGNLDYNRLTVGATIYLPVYREGALLSLGDGHALQGDGEITGQGLETSLDVTFRVEVLKGKSLGQIWAEDADDVMVSGIDNSLDLSLQMATSGMAHWLKDNYGLNDSEVAALLGAAVRYDIAEVVDPRPHVVARLSKKTLAMLRKP